jgi:tetratricopeptide (TPR) repeat protein
LLAMFSKIRQKIEKYPDDEDFKIQLLEIDQERDEIQKKLDDLKDEVIRLAENFTNIQLETERVELVRQDFELGNYAGIEAILDGEMICSELNAPLHKSGQSDQKLEGKADEFLMLARTTVMDFTLPNRFEKANAYFEQSLIAARNPENLYEYAQFLHEQNNVTIAQFLYEEALQKYTCLAASSPEAHLPYVAIILNNLGLLLADKNEFQAAEAAYQESLTIRRSLAEADPQSHLPNIATTLNNLAALHYAKNEFAAAEAAYQEALAIVRQLAEANSPRPIRSSICRI